MENKASPPPGYSAFEGTRLLASGPLETVALAIKRASQNGTGPFLVFDDSTGRVVDLDLRGSEVEVVSRLIPATSKGPGRPKLGVVAREVTLLPQHWDWLNSQPGGASVTLRKLVHEARQSGAEKDGTRAARDAAYRFVHAMAGDLPGFEESSRALFAGDRQRFEELMERWPADVRGYALQLAFDSAA